VIIQQQYLDFAEWLVAPMYLCVIRGRDKILQRYSTGHCQLFRWREQKKECFFKMTAELTAIEYLSPRSETILDICHLTDPSPFSLFSTFK
jgi:hypothetical protein